MSLTIIRSIIEALQNVQAMWACHVTGAVPASQRRGQGGAALLVLASEQPADRLDAERVHALLNQLAASPAEAADKYRNLIPPPTRPPCSCCTHRPGAHDCPLASRARGTDITHIVR